MVSGLTGTYEHKLNLLGLTSLEANRERGDMIEMFKMMTGLSKIDFRQFFQLAPVRLGAGNTRGNSGYLNVQEPKLSNTDIRRFSFSQRCPRKWNTLPDSVKMAGLVASFKIGYDEFVAASTSRLL